ncbi:MAG: choice-of-anchor V domain-containing protein [Candidatus Binatia bacterium]
MKRLAILPLLVTLGVPFPDGVSARSAGIANQTSGCGGSGCHGTARSDSATVTISAPSSIPPTAGGSVAVTISDPTVPIGGVNAGGFDLRAPSARLSPTVPGDPNVQNFSASEMGHTTTGNNQRSWTVRWDPPVIPSLCVFRLNAAANAVNGDGLATTSDHWNTASHSILVDFAGDGATPVADFRVPAPATAYVNGATLPAPATIVIGNLVLEVVVTDDTGIAVVEIFDADALGTAKLGNAGWSGLGDAGTTNRFTFSWNGFGEPPGEHRLTARVRDCAGRSTEVTFDVLVL